LENILFASARVKTFERGLFASSCFYGFFSFFSFFSFFDSLGFMEKADLKIKSESSRTFIITF